MRIVKLSLKSDKWKTKTRVISPQNQFRQNSKVFFWSQMNGVFYKIQLGNIRTIEKTENVCGKCHHRTLSFEIGFQSFLFGFRHYSIVTSKIPRPKNMSSSLPTNTSVRLSAFDDYLAHGCGQDYPTY